MVPGVQVVCPILRTQGAPGVVTSPFDAMLETEVPNGFLPWGVLEFFLPHWKKKRKKKKKRKRKRKRKRRGGGGMTAVTITSA